MVRVIMFPLFMGFWWLLMYYTYNIYNSMLIILYLNIYMIKNRFIKSYKYMHILLNTPTNMLQCTKNNTIIIYINRIKNNKYVK